MRRRSSQARRVETLIRNIAAASGSVSREPSPESGIAAFPFIETLLNPCQRNAPSSIDLSSGQLARPQQLVKIVQPYAQPTGCSAWGQVLVLRHKDLLLTSATGTAHTLILLECYVM